MSEYSTLELRLRAADTPEVYRASLNFRAEESAEDVELAGDVSVRLDFPLLLSLTMMPEDYGNALSASLFADPMMRSGWDRAFAYTQGMSQNLRLVLRLDPRDDALQRIAWELLHEPGKGRPIALYESITLHRAALSTDLGSQPVSSRPNPTALIVAVAPVEAEAFGFGPIAVSELAARAVTQLDLFSTQVLQSDTGPVTLAHLSTALQAGPTIFYLVCHVRTVDREVYFWFQQDDGKSKIVGLRELAHVIGRLPAERRPVLLVILGVPDRDDTPQLGPLLTTSGVSAILTVTDRTPLRLIDPFLTIVFRELRRSGNLPTAVTRARQSVQAMDGWWQPVLYTRGSVGRLWKVEPSLEDLLRAVAPSEAQTAVAEIAKVLEALALGQMTPEEAQRLLGNEQSSNLLRQLAGQTITASRTMVTFGGAQTGDITIGNTAGRDIISLSISTSTVKAEEPLSPEIQKLRQQLKDGVRKLWIEGLLVDTLHNACRSIIKQNDDHADEPPVVRWNYVRLPDRITMTGVEAKIESVYALFGGAMLIEGEAGMGRRRILRALASELLARAEADEGAPVPLLLSLAEWPAATSLDVEAWFELELERVYDLPAGQAKLLLKERQVALLLDGLEQVEADARGQLIEALALFRQRHWRVPLVVVCGAASPEGMERLLLRGTVTLQPLLPHQILALLKRGGEALAALRGAFEASQAWQELLSTPVLLDLAVITYHGRKALPSARSVAVLRTALLMDYERRMLEKIPPTYRPDQAEQLLSQLARGLSATRKELFYLEDLGPAWLPVTPPRTRTWSYPWAAALRGGGVALLAGLLVSAPVALPLGMLLTGLRTRSRTRKLYQRLSWSWQRRRSRDREPLRTGLVTAAVAVAVAVVIIGLVAAGYGGSNLPETFASSWIGVLFFAILGFLLSRLSFVLTERLQFHDSLIGRAAPELSIQRMRRSMLYIFLLVITILTILMLFPLLNILFGPLALLAFYFLLPILALELGGEALAQHYALRTLLARNGVLARDPIAFLRDMSRCGLLRQVGGGFGFAHPLLQEYYSAFKVAGQPEPERSNLWSEALDRAAGRASLHREPGELEVLQVELSPAAMRLIGPGVSFPSTQQRTKVVLRLGNSDTALRLYEGYLSMFGGDAEEYLARLDRLPCTAPPALELRGPRGEMLPAPSALLEGVIGAMAVTLSQLTGDRLETQLLKTLMNSVVWLSPHEPILPALATALLERPPYGFSAEAAEAALASALQLRLLMDTPVGPKLDPVISGLWQELLSDQSDLQRVELTVLELTERDQELVGLAHLLALAEPVMVRTDERACALSEVAAALLLTEQRYGEARVFAKRAVEIQASRSSLPPADMARALTTLGRSNQALGNISEAVEALTQALSIRESTLGPQHPITAESMSTLAEVLAVEGQAERALELAARALDVYSALPSPPGVGFAARQLSYASLQWSLQRYDEAADGFKRALELYRSNNEAESIPALLALLRLGLTTQDRGELDVALPNIESAVNGFEEAVGPEHPDAIFARLSLGLLYIERREIGSARVALTRALSRLDDLAADGGDNTITAISRLRDALEELVKAAEAPALSQRLRALGRASDALGELTPRVITSGGPLREVLPQAASRVRMIVDREAGRAGRSDTEISARIHNPYFYTKPVGAESLIGRDDIFDKISDRWRKQGTRDSIIIHGHRRMGKTSIAQALAKRIDFQGAPVLCYVTCERIDIDDEAGFYYSLAVELRRPFRQHMPVPDETAFVPGKARTALNQFLQDVEDHLAGRSLILILDEFELIFEQLGKEGALNVVNNLRGQTQSLPWLDVVLVGRSDLEDLTLNYKVMIYGWSTIQVSFLSYGQVARVLANPVPDFALEYDSAALELIFNNTNGQPFLVQVIGNRLVELYNSQVFDQGLRRRTVLAETDVRAVLDDPGFYSTAASYFEGVWQQVTGGQPGEQGVCFALAPHPQGLTFTDLTTATVLAEDTLQKALDGLKRHDILILDGERWRYAVPLMRRWVYDTHPHETTGVSTPR